MPKKGFKLGPQPFNKKCQLNHLNEGLHTSFLIKNWLIETPVITVQIQHIFHSTNYRGNIRGYRS